MHAFVLSREDTFIPPVQNLLVGLVFKFKTFLNIEKMNYFKVES